MSVRRFIEEDRQVLRYIYFESRRSAFPWLSEESLEFLDFDKDTQGESIWVSEREGSVVGFVSVYEAENFIHNIFVRPEWVGRGCGSELLAACLESMGRPAWLKCVAENTRALEFYRVKGWTTVDHGVSEDGRYFVLEMAGVQ